MVKFFVLLLMTRFTRQYLVSDLDKEDEDDDNKQVVENADNSNDDVDDLECKVTDVENVQHNVVIFRQGRVCAVVQDITWQRCVVLHRCRALSNSAASATIVLYILMDRSSAH